MIAVHNLSVHAPRHLRLGDLLLGRDALDDVNAFIAGGEPTVELKKILSNLAARGLSDFVKVDYHVIRGLAYYTGTVFEAFDRPDTNASCPRRNHSTIAPQALILLNSEFSLAAARNLAGFVLSHSGKTIQSQLGMVYERVLCRPSTAAESASGLRFLREQTAKLKESNRPVTELALPEPLPVAELCTPADGR